MLLLDEAGHITHLTILVLGAAHVGKTALIHSFLTGSKPPSVLANPTVAAALARKQKQEVRAAGNDGEEEDKEDGPTLKRRNTTHGHDGLYLSQYEPTIENAHTVQYVMPWDVTKRIRSSVMASRPSVAGGLGTSSNIVDALEASAAAATTTSSSSGSKSTNIFAAFLGGGSSSSSANNPDSEQSPANSTTTSASDPYVIDLPPTVLAGIPETSPIARVFATLTPAEQARQQCHRIILTLIDVGGHPFYSGLLPGCIHAADAFMLVYDVGDRKSFDALWGIYRRIVETKWVRPKEIPVVMVGNMVDTVVSQPTPLSSSSASDPTTTNDTTTTIKKRPRQVTTEMAHSFASLLKIPFCETTARAPQSVSHCFRNLVLAAQEKGFELMEASGVGLVPTGLSSIYTTTSTASTTESPDASTAAGAPQSQSQSNYSYAKRPRTPGPTPGTPMVNVEADVVVASGGDAAGTLFLSIPYLRRPSNASILPPLPGGATPSPASSDPSSAASSSAGSTFSSASSSLPNAGHLSDTSSLLPFLRVLTSN
ncbi:hypothetical protein HK102_004695 [Quaeritorhiza haematococci]|nr:hypothetical protein HK102_004695 [Quaeritorhiza haematococci]